jgi:hypothetical protein
VESAADVIDLTGCSDSDEPGSPEAPKEAAAAAAATESPAAPKKQQRARKRARRDLEGFGEEDVMVADDASKWDDWRSGL